MLSAAFLVLKTHSGPQPSAGLTHSLIGYVRQLLVLLMMTDRLPSLSTFHPLLIVLMSRSPYPLSSMAFSSPLMRRAVSPRHVWALARK